MREVRAGVRSEDNEQFPFADGDEQRAVFGEASNRADASIQILTAPEEGKIKFAAGANHGVQAGRHHHAPRRFGRNGAARNAGIGNAQRRAVAARKIAESIGSEDERRADSFKKRARFVGREDG